MKDFLYLLFSEYTFLKFVNETGGGLAWSRLFYFSRSYDFFPDCSYYLDLDEFEKMIAVHVRVNADIRILLKTGVHISNIP